MRILKLNWLESSFANDEQNINLNYSETRFETVYDLNS